MTDRTAITAALHLVLLLMAQPSLPVVMPRDASARRERPSSAAPVDEALARKLATVRGLLAKAESTTFDDEADALSAKAQELISRYALDRLLDAEGSDENPERPDARRIWLEAPYLVAKAQLVHEVALANRCRAVLSDPPGVSTVVGGSADIAAVELLVTSLLVQANGSMLRHGRAVDARGASRTRSFRQSFLTSFAVRIGQRLRETFDEVLAESGQSTSLLPALRSQEQAVADAFDALVPHTTTSSATVSNGAGWTAGQVAADLALIDVQARIEPAVAGERAG